jgi:putative hydrolase of HD superfamily
VKHVDLPERIVKKLHFIKEVDKLKSVSRRAYITDHSRYENSAEHSWHIAVMALLLGEHAPESVDRFRVLELLLIHDMVEIYAGDTFCYDEEGIKGQHDREVLAADQLFALLPEDLKEQVRAAWDEFEALETPEANFARSLDRLQPILINYATGGKGWKENGVTPHMVRERIPSIANGSESLADIAYAIVDAAEKQGFLN